MKKTETPKYIAVIDYKATALNSGFGYKALAAKNLIEAMSEAKKIMDADIYLLSIFEKLPGGDKEMVNYNRVLTNRGRGWHTNDDGERDESFEFCYKYCKSVDEIKSFDVEWNWI